MQLSKLLFFSYPPPPPPSCYVQTLPLQTWTHEFTLSPPQHFCTHTYRLNHTSYTAPCVFPKHSTMGKGGEEEENRWSCYSFLPFLHPSPPLLTLPSPTQITLSSQHSPLFGTHVDTAGQQDKDCYTQQTSQGHHTGYEHQEGDWRGEEKAK